MKNFSNFLTLAFIIMFVFVSFVAVSESANTAISGLTELTTVSDDDLLAIVDDVAGTPTTKKITRANLMSGELTTSGINISGSGASTITSATGLAIDVVGAGSSINFLTDGASDPQIQAGLSGAGVNVIDLTESGITFLRISPEMTVASAGTGSTTYVTATIDGEVYVSTWVKQ